MIKPLVDSKPRIAFKGMAATLPLGVRWGFETTFYWPLNLGGRFSMKAVKASIKSLDGTILVLMEAT
jgi:hypothetical protein